MTIDTIPYHAYQNQTYIHTVPAPGRKTKILLHDMKRFVYVPRIPSTSADFTFSKPEYLAPNMHMHTAM